MTDRDAIEWSRASGAGRAWIRVDLARGTLAWRPDGEAPRPLDADDVAHLRALAAAVRQEDAADQPSDPPLSRSFRPATAD